MIPALEFQSKFSRKTGKKNGMLMIAKEDGGIIKGNRCVQSKILA